MTNIEAANILSLLSCIDCNHYDINSSECYLGIFDECTEARYLAIKFLKESGHKNDD